MRIDDSLGKRKIFGFLRESCVVLFFLSISFTVYAQENDKIIVDFGKEVGLINKKILSNNCIGYDPKTYETWHDWTGREYYGDSDFGAGIWDLKRKQSVAKVIELAKEAGISILRFPGGCGTHHYNWKDAVGKKRKSFLYGIDEFLKTCDEIGAEAVFTVSYFTGSEQDAADLVEYLNAVADEELMDRLEGVGRRVKGKEWDELFKHYVKKEDGELTWANYRALNGHPEPYNIKYFEIGNEVWHGNHKNIKKILPEEYAKRYLQYYEAMKAVGHNIRIGAVLYTQVWNRNVLEIVNDKLDFGIIHTYPSPGLNRNKLEKMDAKDIFKVTLSVPILRDEVVFQDTLKLLKEKSGKDIPLAITEYNGGFVQEKPVPYRHCLGTALLNAELLCIFMKPESNILMANYWQFCNSYWGIVANGFDGTQKTINNSYYKRPNYYVFEMYAKHFGDILINADVKCDTYGASVYYPINSLVKRIKAGTLLKNNLISGTWVITELPGVCAEEKFGMLSVDFIEPAQFNYYHARKTATVQAGAYYKLSGYIKTEGLIDETGVCLEVQDARGWNLTKSAAATEKVNGTTDWQYVEVIYETLPDAKAVTVLARRVGEIGPLKGKAYFKDVKIEKFIPSLDAKIPYLSVNASKSTDEKKVYLMVINKNMDLAINAMIDLKGFIPASKGNAWVLNGPSVDATNEKKHNNVKVTQHGFSIKGNPFEFTFEPHSLTAIEIEGRVVNAEFSEKVQ